MFQLALGLLILIFGIFLKVNADARLATSKKFWWMFVLIGILSIIGQLFIMYQKGNM